MIYPLSVKPEEPTRVAELWEAWCGVPQCRSAIPLAFGLVDPHGEKMFSESRLKDIRAAIQTLKATGETL